jgi:hypothetical protein
MNPLHFQNQKVAPHSIAVGVQIQNISQSVVRMELFLGGLLKILQNQLIQFI